MSDVIEHPRKVLDWDRYWINHAILAATKSKDPSTQVGCVIVSQDNQLLSTGYNGFARGIADTEDNYYNVYSYWDQDERMPPKQPFDRWQRPQKYSWCEHSERNACYNAARYGIMLKGSKAYMNWEPRPCADCTRALIQSGIVEIIGTDVPFGGKGAGTHYHITYADQMLKEAGVKQTIITGYLHGQFS